MPDDFTPVGFSQLRGIGPFRASKGVPPANTKLHDDIIMRIHAASLSSDQSQCDEAITFALSKGIRSEVIADQYIPTVARLMGDEWCADKLSFAYVTIGVARLQGMLRDLGPAWSSDAMSAPDAPTVMLVVGDNCSHTLGAMVLAGQLRRRGLSVQLLLGAMPSTVKAGLKQSECDAAFLSSSCGDSLDSLRLIVNSIRSMNVPDRKIVVGGSLLTITPDIETLIGADFASNDPDEAIRLCGLDEKTWTGPKIVGDR